MVSTEYPMAEEHQNLFHHLHEILSRGEDPAAQSQQIWNTYGTTVAVMVLDSSGFTRVAESHGILHFLSRLAVMRNVVEAVMTSYDYRLFRFEADNVFAAFDSPDDAIRAALDSKSFPDVPIMEDVMLGRRLKRLGRIVVVPARVRTSARRWEREGVVRTTLRNAVLITLYLLGVHPRRLARWYGHVRGPKA